MANFIIAFQITDGHEGGYSNVHTDRGGETYRGISRRMWPGWAGWVIIDNAKLQADFPKNLKQQDLSSTLDVLVSSFYKAQFWDVNKLDSISSQLVANELYDTGVNMGVGVAARFLQRALNCMNKDGRSWPDIKVDGVIGANTIKAANTAPPDTLVKVLNCLQGARYVDIVEGDRLQEANFIGWINKRVSL